MDTCAAFHAALAERDRLQSELDRMSQGPTTTMPTEIAEAYEEVARAVEDAVEDCSLSEMAALQRALEKLRKAGVSANKDTK